MKDQISIDRIKKLHPDAIGLFQRFIEEAENTLDITLRVTQGLRTFEEQNELYAQGRTKPGSKVTNAKGGQSFHNYGISVDLVEMKNGQPNWNFDFKKLKPIAEKYGIEWGGDFKSIVDKPHFQLSFGYTWQQLLEKYNKKEFIPGTKFVKL